MAQMKAGNDLLMPGNPQQMKTIIDAVRNGDLDSTVLDRNVERILNIVLRSPTFKGYAFSNHPGLKAHASVARNAAANGMILLKNDSHTLPLVKTGARVATFGNSSYETIIGGTGSGDVNEAYSVSIAAGLLSAGLEVDTDLQDSYRKYIKDTRATLGPPKNWLARMMGTKMPVPEMAVTGKEATEAAANTDVALITIGRCRRGRRQKNKRRLCPLTGRAKYVKNRILFFS